MIDTDPPTDEEILASEILEADGVPLKKQATYIIGWRKMDADPIAQAKHVVELRKALRGES